MDNVPSIIVSNIYHICTSESQIVHEYAQKQLRTFLKVNVVFHVFIIKH